MCMLFSKTPCSTGIAYFVYFILGEGKKNAKLNCVCIFFCCCSDKAISLLLYQPVSAWRDGTPTGKGHSLLANVVLPHSAVLQNIDLESN